MQRRQLMELSSLWLPLIGGGILIAIAISAWFADHKIVGIWFGFAGFVCLLLLAALQIQESVDAETNRPSPTDAEVRQLRAYVSVVEGNVGHTIGRAPTVSLVLKNTGQTEARNVTWLTSFAVAAVDAEIPLDKTRLPATNILAPGGTLSYQYTFETWKPEWDTLLKAEAVAIIAVGEIDYLDVYGNHWPSTYRFISGGAFGRSSGIAPGKFGMAPNAPQSKK